MPVLSFLSLTVLLSSDNTGGPVAAGPVDPVIIGPVAVGPVNEAAGLVNEAVGPVNDAVVSVAAPNAISVGIGIEPPQPILNQT